MKEDFMGPPPSRGQARPLGSPTGDQRAEGVAFTPGPWAFRIHEPSYGIDLLRLHWRIGSAVDGKGVAFVFGDDESNARLIAAAPDLLAALRGLLAADRGGVYGTQKLIAAAWAAIDKALGDRSAPSHPPAKP
jgi:hypothetical protein